MSETKPLGIQFEKEVPKKEKCPKCGADINHGPSWDWCWCGWSTLGINIFR